MARNKFILVETIQTFRHRYVVEVPEGKDHWALDTVTCQQAKEFSQTHLGETVVSHRPITLNEAMALCDVDNHYCKTWDDQAKREAFITYEKDLKKQNN